MKPKHKRGRSELQHHHDLLLHKSRRDPLAYYKASLEDMAETVKGHRETALAAEEGERHCKKVLAGAQNQVGHLSDMNGRVGTHRCTSLLGSGRSSI